MSFTFKKKCVVFCALAILTLLAYKIYSEKNELHGNLYKLHKSFVHLYAVPDLWTAEHKKEFTKATWGQLKTRPAFMKSLSKVSEALPLSYEEQTQDQKKEALISLHQSYFLKVRQAAFLVRQSYINIIYSPETTNPYAGYVPKPKIDKKGKDLSFYKSNLQLKEAEVIHKKGEIDYLVIGSGPAGSLIAHELKHKFKGARVVIMDTGPFIRPQSRRTNQAVDLLENKGGLWTHDEGILIKNGAVIGGGTMVNLDLAFSPLLPPVKKKLRRWTKKGWISSRIIGEGKDKWKRLQSVYGWVENKIGTRIVANSELNKNNELLLTTAPTAKKYDLNQKKPTKIAGNILKISAVDAFLLPALKKDENDNHSTLDVIPSAKADKIVFEGAGVLRKAHSVEFTFQKSDQISKAIKDMNELGGQPGQKATIKARHIIVSAGALGSATLLLKSDIVNPNIGKGIVLHPSMPVIGLFDKKINLMAGGAASVYIPSEGSSDQYFYESMGSEPSVVAQIIPGFGTEIAKVIKNYAYLGGFDVRLIDSVSKKNHIAINPLTEEPQIRYQLIESDKNRFRQALKKGIKMLFDQGAKKVFIPSLELVHEGNLPIFEAEDDYEKAIDCLQFKPAANFITSAHMQSSNKMGDNPMKSVVDHKFRVWNPETSTFFNNLFVVDGSIFPESIGAQPMQTIYTFAKLFIQKLTNKPLVV